MNSNRKFRLWKTSVSDCIRATEVYFSTEFLIALIMSCLVRCSAILWLDFPRGSFRGAVPPLRRSDRSGRFDGSACFAGSRSGAIFCTGIRSVRAESQPEGIPPLVRKHCLTCASSVLQTYFSKAAIKGSALKTQWSNRAGRNERAASFELRWANSRPFREEQQRVGDVVSVHNRR